jgi:phospholipid/cholesterol/gamma-HCH transport system ATP-binding protein
MPLFKVDSVTFSSGSLTILKNVSLEVSEGAVVEFHGPSGCGKSIMLKIIAGILLPTRGSVYYKGKNLNALSRIDELQFRADCAFVFQDSALWANQTIAQNLMLPLEVHFPHMSIDERNSRIKTVCDRVSYNRDLNVRPAELSIGEQKKIAIARALVCEPRVLFLDECTASLDDKSASVVMKILHEFVDKGNTILYISHAEQFRWEFPGTLYELENGIIKQQDVEIDDLR